MLCQVFDVEMTPARLSGSENLSRAIAWAEETMKADGLEQVRTEPVVVPRWVRIQERAEIIRPPRHDVAMLALGGSVATPAGGIEGDVLVVSGFDDLQARRAEARGRIVLFNVPFTTYSDTVSYRTSGARAAAQHGALAVLIRSVGPVGLRTPHTGSVQYGPGQTAIPAAAIAAEDANRIARLTARGRQVRLRLTIDARYEAEAESANVVGEIRGRENPDEIVLVAVRLAYDTPRGVAEATLESRVALRNRAWR